MTIELRIHPIIRLPCLRNGSARRRRWAKSAQPWRRIGCVTASDDASVGSSVRNDFCIYHYLSISILVFWKKKSNSLPLLIILAVIVAYLSFFPTYFSPHFCGALSASPSTQTHPDLLGSAEGEKLRKMPYSFFFGPLYFVLRDPAPPSPRYLPPWVGVSRTCLLMGLKACAVCMPKCSSIFFSFLIFLFCFICLGSQKNPYNLIQVSHLCFAIFGDVFLPIALLKWYRSSAMTTLATRQASADYLFPPPCCCPCQSVWPFWPV